MTLTAIDFKPGIFSDDSPFLSENAYNYGNNVRFERGRPQVIGGWEAISSDTFLGPARGAHAWSSAGNDRVAAFGTAYGLYSFLGGDITDITPYKAQGTLYGPFSFTKPTSTITVNHPDHGLVTGDLVTFTNATPIHRVSPSTDYLVDGEYEITVVDPDTYTIDFGSTLPNDSFDATTGGRVQFTVALPDGEVDSGSGSGWGTGTYGGGPYGVSSTAPIAMRQWALGNWGTNLVAVVNDGPLFEWAPARDYDTIIENGGFDDASNWKTQAATGGTSDWAISGGKANMVDGSGGSTDAMLSQDVSGRMRGGVFYELTFDVTFSAGNEDLDISIETGELDESDEPIVVEIDSITHAGSYRQVFHAPSLPKRLIFTKPVIGTAGTLDNVVVRELSTAYRIQSAPYFSRGMFVDPNRFVVLYGTIEADGDYNPMLVRWSAQENNRVWLPDVDNLAGEYVLGKGTKIVAGLATRGENLIFTDDALYRMRFNGVTFTFDLVGTGCGLIGMHAVVEHQGSVFWLGTDGQFRIYRGGEAQIIECPIRRETVDHLSFSQGEKVCAGIIGKFNEVIFFYPDRRDGNECSRYAAFNWAEGTWYSGQFGRTAWIPAGIFQNPIGFSPSDLKAYFHERGTTQNGASLEWSLRTGQFNVGDGDRMFAIHRYVPDFSNQLGNMKVKFTFWQWARGPQFTMKEYEYGPGKAEIPLRQLGRVGQIEWSNGTNSQSARWGTQIVDIQPRGARR